METDINFKSLIDSQHTLNELSRPDNVDVYDDDYKMALLTEIAELLDSMSFKWWAKQEFDYENIKIEMVDILHFFFSLLHRKHGKTLKKCVKEHPKLAYEDGQPPKLTPEHFRQVKYFIYRQIMWFIVYIQKYDYKSAFISYLFICNALCLDIQELIHLYKMKNALNTVRQMNGYKDGKYHKMWGDVEDNAIVTTLVKPEMSIDEMINTINYYYSETVLRPLALMRG